MSPLKKAKDTSMKLNSFLSLQLTLTIHATMIFVSAIVFLSWKIIVKFTESKKICYSVLTVFAPISIINLEQTPICWPIAVIGVYSRLLVSAFVSHETHPIVQLVSRETVSMHLPGKLAHSPFSSNGDICEGCSQNAQNDELFFNKKKNNENPNFARNCNHKPSYREIIFT